MMSHESLCSVAVTSDLGDMTLQSFIFFLRPKVPNAVKSICKSIDLFRLHSIRSADNASHTRAWPKSCCETCNLNFVCAKLIAKLIHFLVHTCIKTGLHHHTEPRSTTGLLRCQHAKITWVPPLMFKYESLSTVN